MTNIYILSAKRTPIGSFQGQLQAFQGWQLGANAIAGATQGMNENGACDLNNAVDAVFMGCVLGAGQGQAPARQATIAGLGRDNVPATTVNKVCGSGMQAIAFAAATICNKQHDCVVAGGFESMTNAPYILPKARNGYRMGHGTIMDHMMLDGLEDAYDIAPSGTRRAMGVFADATAEKYGLSREDQEQFATTTFNNYHAANDAGLFDTERLEISYTDTKGNVSVFNTDEPPSRVKPTKFQGLRPAFSKTGTVTAATSSSIADGAAALLLAGESALNGAIPLARIVGFASHASAPEWFTTAPIGAIEKLLQRINWTLADVDLFEINEAFAVVPMAAMKELNIGHDRVNVHGGACTFGHPIGASGARIVVTLIHALRARGLKRGVAAACIGGGEATAIAVEICG